MGIKILQGLFICHLLEFLCIFGKKSVVSVLKDNSWLLLKLKHCKVLNIPSHKSCGFGHRTLIGNCAVGHWGNIGYCSVSGTHVLLQVLLEAREFFIWFRLCDFLFDTFWNEFTKLELWFFFSGLDISLSQSCSSIFRDFSLHFLNLLFSVMFLLFDILILVSDLSFFIRERLLPCWFDKTEELVLVFFLFTEKELISFGNGFDSSKDWSCYPHLFFILILNFFNILYQLKEFKNFNTGVFNQIYCYVIFFLIIN